MFLNLGSILFNASLTAEGGTPAWGTEMGQGDNYKFSFENMDDLFIAMVYNAIEDCRSHVYCPLGKGGNRQNDYKFVLASLFKKIYVNDIFVPNAEFVLLIVELLNGNHHVGRRTLKYNENITLDGKKVNKNCFDQIANILGLNNNSAWFISEINFKNQDELHFSAHILNKNTSIQYPTTNERKEALLNAIELDKKDGRYRVPFSSNYSTLPLQQIFFGAPGTGKSFEIDKFTKEYDTIRTTFHPDSDYSTFVGAYKPIMEEVNVQIVPVAVAGGITLDTNKGTYKEKRISYKFVKQAFLKAYLAAWKKYAEGDDENGVPPQFLVIEEINRGNCAQIFGDLFQLLDRQDNGFSSYPIEADTDLQREIADAFAEEGGEYQLPEGEMNLHGAVENYKGNLESDIRSGRILLLPSNLFIWATMNTSDQSLFPIDSAFKRRWDWHYVKIADAKQGYKIKCGDETCDWWTFISKMNDKIAEETSSDDKKLGYFFCKPDKEGGHISLNRFVSKVIFYLWNDVYKDSNTEDFNVSDDPSKEATFEAFYNDDNTENVAYVRKFLVNVVGEKNIVKSDEDNEEYPGTQANEDDHAHEDWSDTEKKRYQYWDAFLKYAPKKSEEFAKYFGGVKTPSRNHWTNFSVPNVDFHLSVLQQREKHALEMKVYYDKTTEEYHKLYSHKAEIEAEMGVTYQWQELPDKKSSYISEYKSDVNFDNEEAWSEQFDFIIDRLLKMRIVFSKYAKM